MTLAQAYALSANVEHEPWRPDLDQKALEALARYLVRFTPTVALLTNDIAEPPGKSAPERIENQTLAVYLDLSGCEHLFGGLASMVRRIAESLHSLRIPATLAVAATPGAAFALTCMPPTKTQKTSTGVRTLIPKSPDAASAAPLLGLRLPQDMLESLHHLGLETIGQLQSLPRKTLPSRFGSALMIRLDQLSGQIPEPLIPLRGSVKLEERFDFDGSVADPQALELVFSDLLAKLLLGLERKAHGIRELVIRLDLAEMDKQDTKPHSLLTLSVSRPSRDTRALLGLYRCAYDQLLLDLQSQGTRPKRSKARSQFSLNFDAGFTSMTLSVIKSQPLPHQQLRVNESDKVVRQQAWQNTLDLIRTRLGESAIQQARLEESYLPEKAYKLMPAGLGEPANAEAMSATNRPLHLHSPPEEVKVMVAPSHDADGIPLSFSYQGELHRVQHAAGPERIAGQWWEGHQKTRDYFDVADNQGSRYWLFRVQETGKWYVHGEFE